MYIEHFSQDRHSLLVLDVIFITKNILLWEWEIGKHYLAANKILEIVWLQVRPAQNAVHVSNHT